MGLLNKNEKTSNVFFEEAKWVISKIARLIYRDGFIPYDDWKNIDESLVPILGQSMHGLPKNASALVFKCSWAGGACSIYIINRTGGLQEAHLLDISSRHSSCFERHNKRVSLSRPKNMNLIFRVDYPDFQRGVSFEISDNMTKYLLGEVYRVA